MSDYQEIINTLQSINLKKKTQEINIINSDIGLGCFMLEFTDSISLEFIKNLKSKIKFDVMDGFKKNHIAIMLDNSDNWFYLYVEIFKNFYVANLDQDLAVDAISKYNLLYSTGFNNIEKSISIPITKHYED